MAHRRGEAVKTWFRSDRVYNSDGYWFFHTREGIEVGPYSSRFDAEVDSEMIKFLLDGVDADEALQVIEDFMHDERRAISLTGAHPQQVVSASKPA